MHCPLHRTNESQKGQNSCLRVQFSLVRAPIHIGSLTNYFQCSTSTIHLFVIFINFVAVSSLKILRDATFWMVFIGTFLTLKILDAIQVSLCTTLMKCLICGGLNFFLSKLVQWLHLRNKTCFPCLHSLVKTEANVWENLRGGFSPAREFSQTLPRFSPGYEGTDNMFYLFYKIVIFSVNKKKDDLRSANCKFSQLGDSQTTLLTSFSCF